MVMQAFFAQETYKDQRECYWKCGFLVGSQLAPQSSVHRRFQVSSVLLQEVYLVALLRAHGGAETESWKTNSLRSAFAWAGVRKAQTIGPRDWGGRGASEVEVTARKGAASKEDNDVPSLTGQAVLMSRRRWGLSGW